MDPCYFSLSLLFPVLSLNLPFFPLFPVSHLEQLFFFRLTVFFNVVLLYLGFQIILDRYNPCVKISE